MSEKLPKLPKLLDRKIYKTGQTRGADDDVIYQNRVARSSTVLIPYKYWSKSFNLPEGESEFDNGFIVLISPNDYFGIKKIDSILSNKGLKLGVNALVFYYSRKEWDEFNPEKLRWKPAQNRTNPLGGTFVARIPATTSTTNGNRILRGFTTTSNKGAGIRVFEYASKKTIKECRNQLEALFWMCCNSESVVSETGMKKKDAILRKKLILKKCEEDGLLDYKKLIHSRVINKNHETICPLCLDEFSGIGFFRRMLQAEGRKVPDITVTDINLFHIDELRLGKYNHCPYNIGWGHHHCNVVTKDSGIADTLKWMSDVLKKNVEESYLSFENKLS